MSRSEPHQARLAPWQRQLLELYTRPGVHVHVAMPRAPGKALALELARGRLVLEGYTVRS